MRHAVQRSLTAILDSGTPASINCQRFAARRSSCARGGGTGPRCAVGREGLPRRDVPRRPTGERGGTVKDKAHFSYESNPSFFLQSGSVVTSTSPGFSAPKSPTFGGQKMVKLTRDEVNWVHEMLISVWMGMVASSVG